MSLSSRAVGTGLTALGLVLIVVAVAPWALRHASTHAAPAGGSGAGLAAVVGTPASAAVPGRDMSSVLVDRDPPRTVLIPAIGVAVELDPLGLRADGALAVPDDFARAGWYVDGPEPGEPGAAVVVGHVDNRSGPAAFFRLHQLRPGQPIIIRTTANAILRFEIERVEKHAKQRFPTAAVYAPTAVPSLRLITCGGEFDRTEATYRDNVIVYARSVG